MQRTYAIALACLMLPMNAVAQGKEEKRPSSEQFGLLKSLYSNSPKLQSQELETILKESGFVRQNELFWSLTDKQGRVAVTVLSKSIGLKFLPPAPILFSDRVLAALITTGALVSVEDGDSFSLSLPGQTLSVEGRSGRLSQSLTFRSGQYGISTDVYIKWSDEK